MRVIAGEARSRKLQAPPGRQTRPITDRAKEGIFNMLVSCCDLDGAAVFDFFAGSGSFGIEALSRGARHVTFVEQRAQAQRTIEANLESLGFTDRSTVLKGSVLSVMGSFPQADLAFCDPPYGWDEWDDLLDRLPSVFLVGHAEHDIVLTERWSEVKRRTYGRSHIVIAQLGAEAG